MDMKLPIPGVSAEVQKYAMYGVLIAVGLLALKVMKDGVGGTTRDLTAGVVGGVFDAVGGVVEGAYMAVPPALHPESPDNFIYKGISGIGESVTGQKGWTLGGQIYDWTH